MKKETKPLNETELRRYWRALKLWDQRLQQKERELNERDEDGEDDDPPFYVPQTNTGAITPEMLMDAYQATLQSPTTFGIRKSIVFNDDDCTITPEEFVTTLPACGPNCYEGGTHTARCQRVIYLDVERIGRL